MKKCPYKEGHFNATLNQGEAGVETAALFREQGITADRSQPRLGDGLHRCWIGADQMVIMLSVVDAYTLNTCAGSQHTSARAPDKFAQGLGGWRDQFENMPSDSLQEQTSRRIIPGA